MAENQIDYDKVQRQLGILMTNSVSFMGNLYNLFVSTKPMDIEVRVWTSENTFETLMIPNRAKGNIPSQYGEGNPNGNVEANYGTTYIDQITGSVYIKTTLEGSEGWSKLITANELIAHDLDSSAHDGVLAKINGSADQTFECADPVLDTDAVNKGSLFALLGGLENLKVLLNTPAEERTIVEAINEVAELISDDRACAVSGALNVVTNRTALMYQEADDVNNQYLVITAPFTCISADGRKKYYTDDIRFNLETLIFDTYNIFIDIDTDELKMYRGEYYKSPYLPPFMSTNDTWLNLGKTPYKVEVVQDDLTREAHGGYAYLGRIEWSKEHGNTET